MFENSEIALEELPDMEDLDWQAIDSRYVKRMLVERGLTVLGILVATAIPTIISGGAFDPSVPLWVLVVLFAIPFLSWPFLDVPRRGYVVRDKDIVFKSGVLWRSVTAIPFNRIQHVETSSTPLDRKFDLATLKLFTAGGSGGDLKISGLATVIAEQLRVYVLGKVGASIDTTGLNPGRHTIFVRGQDANGNWGAFSAAFIGVEFTPTAEFTGNSPAYLGSPTVFTNLTLSYPPAEFFWDFGDNRGASTEYSPSYTYLSTGTFTVTLVATNYLGSDSITVVRADTEAKPATGLAKAKKMVLQDKVDVLTGIVSSAVLGGLRDFVHGAKVPLVVANAGNNDMTGKKCSPYIVRVSFSNSMIRCSNSSYVGFPVI